MSVLTYRKATFSYAKESGEDIMRQVDVYVPEKLEAGADDGMDLLVFIHGGAWRAGDKSDHQNIPQLLASHLPSDRAKRLVIAIPNYTLSHSPGNPERLVNVHPVHNLDSMRSILWLNEPENIEKYVGSKIGEGSFRSIYLSGHSCGSHILSNLVFLLPNVPTSSEQSVTSWTTEERGKLLTIVKQTKGIAFLDGIHDLLDLVTEYPSYEFFVEKAFGTSSQDWDKASVSTQSIEDLPENTVNLLKSQQAPKIVVAHATQDELLSERQSRTWFEWLRDLKGEEGLSYDNTTLVGSHDGCLQHEGLGILLARLF